MSDGDSSRIPPVIPVSQERSGKSPQGMGPINDYALLCLSAGAGRHSKSGRKVYAPGLNKGGLKEWGNRLSSPLSRVAPRT